MRTPITSPVFSAQLSIEQPTLPQLQEVADTYARLIKQYNTAVNKTHGLRDEFLQLSARQTFDADQVEYYHWADLPGRLRHIADASKLDHLPHGRLNEITMLYDSNHQKAHVFTAEEAVWVDSLREHWQGVGQTLKDRSAHVNRLLNQAVGETENAVFGEFTVDSPDGFVRHKPPVLKVAHRTQQAEASSKKDDLLGFAFSLMSRLSQLISFR